MSRPHLSSTAQLVLVLALVTVGCGRGGTDGSAVESEIAASNHPGEGGRPTFSRASALLWQGFHHEWTYNHRVNRLGSFVRPDSTERRGRSWNAVHTAASGTGGDTARFRDFFVPISTPDVRFATGWIEFELHGREDEPMGIARTVEVPLGRGSDMRSPNPSYYAFLNGFDVYSKGDPDKLIDFEVGIGTPTVSRDGNSLTVELGAGLKTDCSTPECRSSVRRTSYVFRVYYVLVRAAGEGLRASRSLELANEYIWNRNAEIRRSELGEASASLPLRRPERSRNGARFGIKHISTTLDHHDDPPRIANISPGADAMHLLEWTLRVRDVSLSARRARVTSNLFFKNWDPEMTSAGSPRRERPPRSTNANRDSDDTEECGSVERNVKKLFAYRSAGSASLHVTGRVLSFGPGARVGPSRSVGGRIDWEPEANVESRAAVHRTSVRAPTR